jgi:hypothetical protein
MAVFPQQRKASKMPDGRLAAIAYSWARMKCSDSLLFEVDTRMKQQVSTNCGKSGWDAVAF